MLLHHERIVASGASPERWMLLLHGIFGAGRNWSTVARRVVAERPDWGIVPVDLRQHGASQGFSPPHTLAAAADDLRALVEAEGLDARAVLGHSFGGKVALVYARDPAAPLAQLWVVDSAPSDRAPAGSAWEMLRALQRLPDSFEDREAGIQGLVEQGVLRPTAQWMATNLTRGADGRMRWRISPPDMEALLRDFFSVDAWDVVERPPEGLEVHIVKAEESSVLGDDAEGRIEEAGERTHRVHLHHVAGGHWVNADNPDAIVALLTEKLPR